MFIDLNLVSIVFAGMSASLMFRIENINSIDKGISDIRKGHLDNIDEQLFRYIYSRFTTRCSTIMFLISYLCDLVSNMNLISCTVLNNSTQVFSVAITFLMCEIMWGITK